MNLLFISNYLCIYFHTFIRFSPVRCLLQRYYYLFLPGLIRRMIIEIDFLDNYFL